MGQKWTDEQQLVIDTRDKNILVSAAAGSGKTAVLVERIIKRITDSEHPIDIDRMLVVTFTKAAASEMRERVLAAIDKKREDEPSDENLLRQSSLIHNAMITTIDSFCLFVVRNHFEEICLDPNFRIADEGEMALLKMDVLRAVFEREYAKEKTENEAFLRLIDMYSGKRSDVAVKDMVMRLYNLSASSPWPREWLDSLCGIYEAKNTEELMQSPLFSEIAGHAAQMLLDLCESAQRLYDIAVSSGGPEKYADTIRADMEILQEAASGKTYAELYANFANLEFSRLPIIRKFDGDAAKKDAVSDGRKAIKAEVDKLKNNYFDKPVEELLEQNKCLQPFVQELVRLSLLFTDAMDAAKRKKRIMDFSDIEHFALRILVDEETKQPRPTAEEFRRHFDEIMIDEYQDSNQVQEAILTAISRESQGNYNMFMVGDVKQSIYRFRMARPELFMEKFRAYATEDDTHIRIDLHKNFRSRHEVLDFSNDIFYKIMQTDLGAVAYDEEAALYCGAKFNEAPGFDAEVLLFDTEDPLVTGEGGWDFEKDAPESVEEDLDKKQLEARMVGSRILTLMEELKVTDKASGELRPLKYSDIVILFRSLKGWEAPFTEILGEMGIPAHVESSTGYFSAIEVQTVLNMLRILDNPYQDIPMAAVLKSPMAGLDNEELAEIRAKHPDLPFAAASLAEMKEAEEGTLAEFYRIYVNLRAKTNELPIHELIQDILDETGFRDYVTMLPAGAKRSANLGMLIEKAIAYEKTSYKGLFHFVRYIDSLVKYDIDFGEADVTGEDADVVRIMTIHKSKGLEFPVVFVSGLSKQFNLMDTREKMVVHPDFGIGLAEILPNPKRRLPTLIKTEIAAYLRQEALGEELRVLYVALTRAKEKLILTGTVADKEKTIKKYTGNVLEKKPISYLQRVNATCYLDWVIPAVLSYPDTYDIVFADPSELVLESVERIGQERMEYVELLTKIRMADEKNVQELAKSFSYEYPYKSDADRKIKYSVSELKHMSMAQKYDEEQSEAERPAFLLSEKEHYIPDFAEKEEAADGGQSSGVSQGALRGTAMHRVMECMDFAKICEIDRTEDSAISAFVREELARMKTSGELSEEMQKLVRPLQIEGFARSDTALRMAKAAARGELFKEKPFVMKHEGVLVQGIIDVFWMEEDSLVLLDYKTDRVEAAEELVTRYKTQLDLYADALARIFSDEEKQVTVKESLIYSFALQETIKV
jgi:ATP-dependent helicase/nuclease subunit A